MIPRSGLSCRPLHNNGFRRPSFTHIITTNPPLAPPQKRGQPYSYSHLANLQVPSAIERARPTAVHQGHRNRWPLGTGRTIGQPVLGTQRQKSHRTEEEIMYGRTFGERGGSQHIATQNALSSVPVHYTSSQPLRQALKRPDVGGAGDENCPPKKRHAATKLGEKTTRNELPKQAAPVPTIPRTPDASQCTVAGTTLVASPGDRSGMEVDYDGDGLAMERGARRGVKVREKEQGKRLSGLVLEVDEYDADPCMVSEYAEVIDTYLRDVELQTMPDANYMTIQPELTWSMRTILIDWLVQVHAKFHLHPETLYLTVNLADRFCSCKAVSQTKFQLVGVAALLVAAKYEEVVVPSVNDLVYIVENGYDREEILRAERYLLSMLGFNVGAPGPLQFLRRINRADDYDVRTRTLGKYFSEAALAGEAFLSWRPSLVAAAGVWLGKKIMGEASLMGDWTPKHVRLSGYSEADILPVAEPLLYHLCKPERFQSVFTKYAAEEYFGVSGFVHGWLKHKGYIS
ncbi:hypothetical protein HDU93_008866 [Gonapodya sp. JEL0774]|nr:hypothetical protein HDU93_008866 [Gonapodya sp. JEL0774]